MKNLVLIFACTVLSAFSIMAQSVEGDWLFKIPTEDGQMMEAKLSMKGGAYDVDLGNDGSVEVKGVYTVDGNTITVQDTEGENACKGDAKGIYNFKVDDKTLVMKRVSDPCEGRGGPDGMSFTRM